MVYLYVVIVSICASLYFAVRRGTAKLTSALIIERYPLFADGIARTFAELVPPPRVQIATDLAQGIALARKDKGLNLVALDLATAGDRAREGIRTLSTIRPGHKVVAFASSEEIGLGRLCLAAGAKGVIPKTMSGPLLLSALRLILAGGTYLPPELLGSEARKDRRGLAENAFQAYDFSALGLLTGRQTEVLALLAEGRTNQEIASRLGIAIATVKLHVNAILRTLNVKNRTQAARLAMSGSWPAGSERGHAA